MALQGFSMQEWLPKLATAFDGPLIGLVLLVAVAAAVAEVWARMTNGPRVVGYAATGLVFGAFGLSDVSSTLPLPAWTRLIFDLALGVMLFELGGRVRISWFRHNPWILLQSVAVAVVAAAAVYGLSVRLGLTEAAAMALAFMALTGSPAVLLRVVSDCGASGQVTERAVVLTATGTLVAVVGSRLYSGAVLYGQQQTDLSAITATLYLLGGSVLLAALLALVSTRVASRMDGRHENAALMQLALLALAVLLARALGLSALLVPLLAGLMIKQLSPRPWGWPQQFGTFAGMLVVMMFVLTAAAWQPALLAAGAPIALALLLVRWAAGTTVLLLFSWPSAATGRQALAAGACLVPMCGTALVVASDMAEVLPANVLAGFMPVAIAAAALAELLGALLVWGGLRLAHETSH
jgi:Sodium/hydrogen exchanger family